MEKLRPADYDQFLKEFQITIPENYNFAFDFVDAVAQSDPHRPALVHLDPEKNRRDLDFAWLSERSSRLANALAEQGIGRGDRVMLILYRRIEFWETMLALHKLGALPIPSPSLLTAKDIAERAQYADIKGIVCENSITQRVEDARSRCTAFRVLVQVDGDAPPQGWEAYEDLMQRGDAEFPRPADAAGGNDPMIIFFTSGTTGMPKMVTHSHTYPLGHYTTGVHWHDLEPGDLHLTLSDTGWGKALWGKFYGQFLAGATVFVWDFRGKFHPAELLDVISEHKVTTFCAPPTVYRFLIREDLSQWDLSHLRHCNTAGELLNESVFNVWKEATGLPIYEGYGQTETCLQMATFTFMEPKPGSIGKPTPGWDIVLLDETGAPCPPGEEGEICIRLKNGNDPTDVLGLFQGYMDEPGKTDSVMHDGFYHTGDKAWVDEDGYYWFLGRTDDLIKASGYRVGPFEVESALITHEAVVEAAVTGVPDPVRGQAVKATVVLAPDFDPSDELTKSIQDHVKRVTAPYKYPRIVEYVDELPKTISGKIKRKEIRMRDLEKYGKTN
ncbi:MAG: AMP-binding protein [Desulfovibrio sp.]|jgi:acetyl-CoA synthetase|nr:AMP-binding protein [Desulfovibrio sp.]